MKAWSLLCFLSTLLTAVSYGQRAKQNLVYVDKEGVLRYTSTKKEASFFGVNYTVPFAYGYRSHKALGVDPMKAIDADVNHMARLGLNAFRVHVWDVEISDSLGNLQNNEHLRLFDYLLYQLKRHQIKILLTPIAFWGNGYPEADIRTNGFSYVYTKGGSVVREEAFSAQENYLKQFFSHVNPYTKLTYRDDPDVVAMEINNEPHHSGPKNRTTEYVSRMAAAVRSTGWTKPIFYNISESPNYADAVVRANVNGHSFQWYPTGLVANHELKGNFLPNVDRYQIPFSDTIPAFRNRARMVYEFDAGDIMQPILYPAMARSYRTAGFQWATQFAYDPLHTAYANTEYQTHYLNLIYTPAKAVSLLIAAKAFQRLPRNRSYGTYPADTLFDVFRVSYKEQLSEMNSEEEFYYTANTSTLPKAPAKLEHIAGVGSSALVKYEGTGAYFLDKIKEGVWELEVFPDAVPVRDPFEKASPKKEVVRILWETQQMLLNLPDLGSRFTVTAIDSGNFFQPVSGLEKSNMFRIRPGKYLVVAANVTLDRMKKNLSNLFYAPPSSVAEPVVVHQPLAEATPHQPLLLSAVIAGIDTAAFVTTELRHSANQWKTVPMQRGAAYTYTALVPDEMVRPGMLNYRIMVKTSRGETYTFPGGFKGNPYAWDEYRSESWQSFVAAADSPLEIFNPTTDRHRTMLYNPDWRNNSFEYIAANRPNQLVVKASLKALNQAMGFQYFFANKIKGRQAELSRFTKLVIRARASETAPVRLTLISSDAAAASATVSLSDEWKEIEIPVGSLQKSDFLLLPRPYPSFQPLLFQPPQGSSFSLADAEKVEIRFQKSTANPETPLHVEVEWIQLKK